MNVRFSVGMALAPSPRGRGRGVKVAALPAPTQWRRRGLVAWRAPLKPLTLTLSQRERGHEHVAKKIPCFCTRLLPGPLASRHSYRLGELGQDLVWARVHHVFQFLTNPHIARIVKAV